MNIGKGIRSAGETLIKVADIHDTFFGSSFVSLTRTGSATVDKGASNLFPKSTALKNISGSNRKWGMVHLIRSVAYTVGWLADANTQFEARFFFQVDRLDTGLRNGGTGDAGTQITTMDTGRASLVHEWRGSFSETDPTARVCVPGGVGLETYQEFPIPIPMIRPYYFNFGAEVTKSNTGTIIISGQAYIQVQSIRVPWKKYIQLLNEFTDSGDQGTITPGRR